jgi:hypothetical protein
MGKVFCSPLLLYPLLFHKNLCHGDAALHIQNVFTKHDLEQWHSYSCEMAAGKQDARICMRKLLKFVWVYQLLMLRTSEVVSAMNKTVQKGTIRVLGHFEGDPLWALNCPNGQAPPPTPVAVRLEKAEPPPSLPLLIILY